MARATCGLLLAVAACSGTASGPSAPDAAPDMADAAPPDAPGPGLRTIVETTWTLPPHVERYLCVRATVTDEFFITRFEPIAPLGTHHTVLTLADPGAPDGVTQCGAAVSSPQMIYGSGVGTEPQDLPPGVAIRVRAGQQLLLNLHLYNTGEEPLTGTSGVRVLTVAPADVVNEAEAVLAGTVRLAIPPGYSDDHYGACTTPGPVTIFAVGPHMHRLGAHQKVTVERTGQVLADRNYSFDEQNVQPVEAQLQAGDRVLVQCAYANDTGHYVLFGESTDAEMCFAILFRYPVQNRFHICLD